MTDYSWRGDSYAVKPARKPRGLLVFKFKCAIGQRRSHADHLPVHQIGGRFDEVSPSGLGGESHPHGSIGLPGQGGELPLRPARGIGVAAAEPVNDVLCRLDEGRGQHRVERPDLRADLILKRQQLVDSRDGIGSVYASQRGFQGRKERLGA